MERATGPGKLGMAETVMVGRNSSPVNANYDCRKLFEASYLGIRHQKNGF
jgi:hypothetical protein